MQSIDNVLKLRKGLKPDDPNPDIFDILWAKKLSGAAKDYTVTGNPLSFLTKKAQTAKSTKVTLEPVQDLHGYDNPWPAGGGKNKFDIEKLGVSPITVSNGVATGTSGNFNSVFGPNASPIYTNNSSDRISISLMAKTDGNQSTSGNGIIIVFEYTDETSATAISIPNNTSAYTRFTATSNASKTLKDIHIGYSASGQNIWYIKEMQIELSNQSTSYAPYSNICPISGRTSVSLYGCGKNQFDYDESKVTVCETSTGTIRSYHPTGITNCTITFSAHLIDSSSVTNTFINVGKLVNGKLNVISTFLSTNGDITNRTVTFAEGEEAVLMSASSEASGITLNLPKYNIQLEQGTTATTYEPYTESNEITISFPALGKNLVNVQDVSGITTQTTIAENLAFSAGTYTLSAYCSNSGSNEVGLRLLTQTGSTTIVTTTTTGSSSPSLISGTFTLSEDVICRLVVRGTASGYNATVTKVQIESGSSATTYEPYTKTCYGGTLDVETGVLTVDKTILNIGILSWEYRTDTTEPIFQANITPRNKPTWSGNMTANAISSMYPITTSNNVSKNGYDKTFAISADGNRIYVQNLDYSDATVFRAAMSGVQICYELNTPTTIQLTPQEVNLIKGQNNLWTDGDEIELTYKA